jgi:hypothetical protein
VSLKRKQGKMALAPGNYTVELTVAGGDGQQAKDSARLRVT